MEAGNAVPFCRVVRKALGHRPVTCGDTEPLCDCSQGAVVFLAGKYIQAVLLCPLLPHMVRSCKAGAPVDARAPAQCRSSKDVDAWAGE